MQGIDSGDACGDEAPIIVGDALGKPSIINMRHDKAAQHEEHIDGQIALVNDESVGLTSRFGKHWTL